MERLTQTSNSGGVAFTFDLDITCQPSEARNILNLATKLKDYEDLEEQGRLIKLPCKIGDKVFKLKQHKYCPTGICHKVISCSECRANTPFGVVEGKFMLKELKEIGKTVFLTQSEAEQKLKEMESD